MSLFNKSKNEDDLFATDEQLIVLDNERRVCDIYENVTADGESVTREGAIKVPLSDCQVFTGTFGRIYVVNANELKYIENAKRLAQLEVSTTLKQLVEFKPEKKPNPNTDMKFWAMFIACIIAIFI